MATEDHPVDTTAATSAPPVTPPVIPPTTPPPAPYVDTTPSQAALAEFAMQESTVAQVLAVLDDAGRAVAGGRPDWVDPDVFGGETREARRMARHTVRAQVRVHQALDMATEAVHQHVVAMETFRAEVLRAEDETEAHLAEIRARLGSVSS